MCISWHQHGQHVYRSELSYRKVMTWVELLNVLPAVLLSSYEVNSDASLYLIVILLWVNAFPSQIPT